MTADLPSTSNLCDAALVLGLANRFVIDIGPVVPGSRVAGPARCLRHFGSVDIFLEAIDVARTGELLVIDNAGRDDEGCIGDLVTLEAAKAGLAGIVIWGRNRDTSEVRSIGLPMFSLGTCPTGPQRLDARDDDAFGSARLGEESIRDGDWLVADDDGIFIAAAADWLRLRSAAVEIRERESLQARALERGETLRDQLAVRAFARARSSDPALTFREHLRGLGGAIEV